MVSHRSQLCCMLLVVAADVAPSLAMRDDNTKTAALEALASDAAEAARTLALGGSLDRAHEGIWKFFKHAEILQVDQRDLQGNTSKLSIEANGEILIVVSGDTVIRRVESRPGAVNTNRLRVVVNGGNLDADAKVQVTLQGPPGMAQRTAVCEDGDCSLDTPPGDTAKWEQDRIAVNFHTLPQDAELTLLVDVSGKHRLSWLLTTADAASGDAQGQAHFLPDDYNPGQFMVEKGKLDRRELTVYDLSTRHKDLSILEHGFEVDKSNVLAEPVRVLTELIHGPSVTFSITDSFSGTVHTQEVPGSMIALQALTLASVAPKQREQILSESLKGMGEGVEAFRKAIENATAVAEQLLKEEALRASAWWKEKTGNAVKCACFSLQHRQTHGGLGDQTKKALPVAHVDATSVPQWFGDGGRVSEEWFEHHFYMPMAEVLGHVALTYNKWVNAMDAPIVHQPLMVLDTQTLDTSDLVSAYLQGDLESMLLRWNPMQRWYYTKLLRGQGYIFSSSPHRGPSGEFTGTPHSAFDLVTAGSSLNPDARESYEMRCLLVDPEHKVDNPLTKANLELPPHNSVVQSMVADVKAMILNLNLNK